MHAEGEGFEPSIPLGGIPVFETGRFNHSRTLPFGRSRYLNIQFTPANFKPKWLHASTLIIQSTGIKNFDGAHRFRRLLPEALLLWEQSQKVFTLHHFAISRNPTSASAPV